MGQKSATETLAALLTAFLATRVWKQADLAREVGVGPEAVRKRLLELQEQGVPLAWEKDGNQVYWSVPKEWFPGGVYLKGEEVGELLRLLGRLPRTKARDRLLTTLTRCKPGGSGIGAAPPPVVAPAETSEREERFLPLVEDAAAQRRALAFGYVSASRGGESKRHASVHRVLVGPPARFVATCHRDGKLKSFRLDRVTEGRLDAVEAFRAAEEAAIEELLRTSVDGFHGGGTVGKHVFFVDAPDAWWVRTNLLPGMTCEDDGAGVRVTAETAAVKRVARFVVGLGRAARAVTPELEAEVRGLAEGALEAGRVP